MSDTNRDKDEALEPRVLREKTELWDQKMTILCFRYAHKIQTARKGQDKGEDHKYRDLTNRLQIVLMSPVLDGVIHHKVKYRFGKSKNFGREWALGPSLQNVPGVVKRLCGGKLYEDADIEQCAMVILLQLALKYSLQTPTLKMCVENRERSWDIVKYQTESELTRDQLKLLFNMTIGGGNYKNVYPKRGCALLTEFKSEVKKVANYFWENPGEFKMIRDYVQDNPGDNGKGNQKGTFLANVLQEIEHRLMLAGHDFLEARGYNVDVLVHDGMQPRLDGTRIAPVSCVLLKEMTVVCEEKTGYRVNWKLKSLKPTADDCQIIGEDYAELDGSMQDDGTP